MSGENPRRLTSRGTFVRPGESALTASGPAGESMAMAFWLVSPDTRRDISPVLSLSLAPESLDRAYSKYVEEIQTLDGYVEQYWGEHLVSLSCSHSTGTFIHIRAGLASAEIDPATGRPYRRDTIALDRMEDLIDLYRNNGLVYGETGRVLLAGRVRLAFDDGIYDGHFSDFNTEETADSPYAFKATWTFKIREVVHQVVTTSVLGTRIGGVL